MAVRRASSADYTRRVKMTAGIWRHALRHTLACLTALLALAVASRALGQDTEKSSRKSGQRPGAVIRKLSLVESIPFSNPPPVALLTKTKCDPKGNIYLVESGIPPFLLGPGGLSSIPVLKLSIDSKSIVPYSVPTLQGYRGVIRSDFDVSPGGNFYSLLEGLDADPERKAPPSYFVAKYHDDGSLDSYLKLGDAPERRLQPFRFAMFRDGNVLIAGTALNNGGPLQPFTAVFDKAGRFIMYAKVPDSPEPIHAPGARSRKGGGEAAPAGPDEGEKPESDNDRAVSLSSSSFIVGAPDGNVYLLRSGAGARLYAISPAGQVIRELDVSVPAPALTATNMGMAGDNAIFISFGRVQSGSSTGPVSSDSPNNLISVINPQTGKVSAVYRLPTEADAFSVPVCAVSSDNFVFVGATADQIHQQVARYAPR
jgi:hypothetical protein